MQVLYVTNFDIALRQEEKDPHAAALIVLEAVSDWIFRTCATRIDRDKFLASGSRDLPPNREGNGRSVEWEHVPGGEVWATRIERRDTSADDSIFVTRVTVGMDGEACIVRVSMARAVSTSGLTPASSVTLNQPSLIAMLAESDCLRVTMDKQIQDGHYLQVRNSGEVEELSRSLNSDVRLPILLLHTRTLEAQAIAARAASRLIGLVRVVTLDYKAARLLHRLMPTVDVPYAGGALVWADSTAAPLEFPSSMVNSSDRESLRSRLIALVAPLSVLTRGRDDVFRKARLAAQLLKMEELTDSSATAAKSGSSEKLLAAMIAERDALASQLKATEDEWLSAEQSVEESAREVSLLKAQLEQLKIANEYTESSISVDRVVDLRDAPEGLIAGDKDSLDLLCQHLEQGAEGHITFTPNALNAWKKASDYQTLDLMRESLIKLAEVALHLYDGEEKTIGHLATWVRENHELKISLQDNTIPAKLGKLVYEDEDYDRIPHVKVNDGVAASQCGRIHFATDWDNKRIIVDHIGLHL